MQKTNGFSKKSKNEKLAWIARHVENGAALIQTFQSYWHRDVSEQDMLDSLSENTLTNFPMPYGIAPNMLINGQYYAVPLVTEESSVVAAIAKAAKFWSTRGGFTSSIIHNTKIGHIHFNWSGDFQSLDAIFPVLKRYLLQYTSTMTAAMEARGGGILSITLLDKRTMLTDYYQLKVTFNTQDAMGANFINSCLEMMAIALKEFLHSQFVSHTMDIIMAILSNYTPDCLVESAVSCPVSLLQFVSDDSPDLFVRKFLQAMTIAQADVYRAVTHNKGIFNGIDAIAIATGNDFRAIEATGHAYAAHNGEYVGLTNAYVKDGLFTLRLKMPLAVGTVGGIIKMHPLVPWSLKLLGNPTAIQLMQIMAAVGLASNFSAVASLVTTGIQQGHMRMHLTNMLHQLGATAQQKLDAVVYFRHKSISCKSVRKFLDEYGQ